MNPSDFLKGVNSYANSNGLASVTAFLDDEDDFATDDFVMDEDEDEDDFVMDDEDEDDFLIDDDFVDDSIEETSITEINNTVEIDSSKVINKDSVEVSTDIRSITIPIKQTTDAESLREEFELWCDKEFVGNVVEEWEDRFGEVNNIETAFKQWIMIHYNVAFADLGIADNLTVSDMQHLMPSVVPLTQEVVDDLLKYKDTFVTEDSRVAFQMLKMLKFETSEILTLIRMPEFLPIFKKYRNSTIPIIGALAKICLKGEFEDGQFETAMNTQPATVSEFMKNYYGASSSVLTQFAGESPDVMRQLMQLYESKDESYEMPVRFVKHPALQAVVKARMYYTECKVAEEFILNGAPDWFIQGYSEGKFTGLQPNASVHLAIANQDCEKFGLKELSEIEEWVVESFYVNNAPISEYKQLLLFKSLGVVIDDAKGVPSLTVFLLRKFMECVGETISVPRTISRMILFIADDKVKMVDAEQVLFDVDYVHGLLDSSKQYVMRLTNDASMLVIMESSMTKAFSRIQNMTCLTSSSIESWANSEDKIDPLHYNALKLAEESGIDVTSLIEKPLEQYNSVDRCFDYVRSRVPEFMCMFKHLGVKHALKILMPLIAIKSRIRFASSFVAKYFSTSENTVKDYNELDKDYVRISMYGVPATLVPVHKIYEYFLEVPRDAKCEVTTMDGMIYFRIG